jgi:hypothetical protein
VAMKKILIAIAIAIMIIALLYSAFAFVNWEMNPKYWDVVVRGLFSFISIAVIGFCALGAYVK